MFEQKMFVQGTFGHDFHPELKPDSNIVVLNPHKGLGNFWTGDAALNLRMFGIETIILYGMSANMCVESHARDAIETGFEVIIVADATGAYVRELPVTPERVLRAITQHQKEKRSL